MENKLCKWLGAATRIELDKLAKYSGRTVGTLRQVAGGYRTGGRACATPEVARDIELAAAKLHRKGLPVVTRGDLCSACARCEYLRQAKK